MKPDNLPEAVLTLIKDAASPVDAFYAAVETMSKYRNEEPILYRALTKIAEDLLGKDFIVDNYIKHAELEDMRQAQHCWYKEANAQLTRDELLEYVLVEDLPNFIKRASLEVGSVLNNIQGILKEAKSVAGLAGDVKKRLGDPAFQAIDILKNSRKVDPRGMRLPGMNKAANMTTGYANKGGNAGAIATSSSPGMKGGLGGMGSMGSPASGFKMGSMGSMGMRKGLR